MFTCLLCISLLPVASTCNLFMVIVRFYRNIKKFIRNMTMRNPQVLSTVDAILYSDVTTGRTFQADGVQAAPLTLEHYNKGRRS